MPYQTDGVPHLSDADFRNLVESIEDYAVYFVDPGGFIFSWNKGAQRLKGYREEEILGKHVSTFYRPEDVAAGLWQRESEAALQNGRFEDIGWRIRKDGSAFWARVVINPLRDDSGKHIGFAKVTGDLTDRAFRDFVEASGTIVWTTDPEGHPNADSPSWRAFTGQSKEDWEQRKAWEPVHPEDVGRLQKEWPAARAAGRALETEVRIRRKDGDYVWMAIRALPLKHSDGTIREWLGVNTDISARKKAEEEWAKAQAIWGTTLKSIGDAVISTDREGKITFLNPVAEELTGWKAVKALGVPLTDVFAIVNEETRKVVPNPVEKVLREGVIVGLANHTVLVRRDGTDVPINDSAAPIKDDAGRAMGAVLVFRDVSEEKRELTRKSFLAQAGEELLRASDFRDSLGAVARLAVPRLADWVGVDIVKERSGEAVFTEQLAVAHVDPAKVTFARELNRRYPPDPRAPTGVPQVIRTGKPEMYREIPPELLERGAVDEEHRRIIEKLQLRSAMIVPLRGRNEVFGAVTFVYAESGRRYGEEDLLLAEELSRRASIVIERRKLEEERTLLLERERAARQEAQVANRAKDEFLAVVSHELRNPLSVMLGRVQLLLQRNLPAEAVRQLQAVERVGQAQARLIEDVLDVSRIISGKLQLTLQPIDARESIEDALAAARPLAKAKEVKLKVTLGSDLDLLADPVRLQQVVSNLVGNAVKFTPPGGRVEVEARRVGSLVRITVRDSGEGIRRELLAEIFEPFRQADASTTRRHGGLGLGLTIVRQLVLAHGGTVRAESDGPAKGALFTVELPADVHHPAGEIARRVPALGKKALQGTKVLAVDDAPEALALLCDVLREAGASVVGVASAGEALEKLAHRSFDALVTDIGMPDQDGYELLRRARALPRGATLPAVAVTAYARPEDAEKAKGAGFRDHLPKPIDPVTLVERLAKLVRR